MAQYDFDEEESTKATSTVGIMAVVIVVILAVGGWFYFKDDATVSVPPAVSSTIDKAKDAAAEVPQAAKDATTKGDQDTTRPNKDGSTGNLDQK